MASSVAQAVEHIKRGAETSVTVTGEVSLSGAVRVANALKGNISVKTLSLNSCQLGDPQLTVVCEALPISTVKTLYVGLNNITCEGAKSLEKLLVHPSSQISNLSLFSNRLGDEGVVVLAKILNQTNLHTLDIGQNELSNAGLSEIAGALRGSLLQDIYLQGNKIDNEGVLILAQGIRASARVQRIDLQDNSGISDDCIPFLLESLRTHGSIRQIVLESTQVSREWCAILNKQCRMLQSKRSRILTALCSAGHVSRVGKHSSARWLPPDVLRILACFIRFDDDE